MRAGRGFIFPYNMAKSNNPWWYNPEYTGSWTGLRNVVRTDSMLGVAGISATTRDTLANLKVSFRGEVYSGYTFDRVKVLHRMDSSYEVTAFDTDPRVHITKRVDVAGGYTEFLFDRQMDTLRLRFQRTDTTQRQFTLRGIILENKDPVYLLACDRCEWSEHHQLVALPALLGRTRLPPSGPYHLLHRHQRRARSLFRCS